MTPSVLSRLVSAVLFLIAVVALTGGVWRYGYVQAVEQLADRGRVDLALATDRLSGQLQLYQQLAVVTADHPMIEFVLHGAPKGTADQLLLRAADKTAALDLFVVNTDGQIIASANRSEPTDVSDREFFKRASQGALGEDHGINQATGLRAYYFAAPVFDYSRRVAGALVVVANIQKVEAEWRGARPSIFFTDRDGIVFITNRSELLNWRQNMDGSFEDAAGAAQDLRMSTLGTHEIWHSTWSPYVPERAIHMQQDLPAIGMQADALINVAEARRLAALQASVVAAVLVAFAAFLFLATERRRTLAEANARLESRVSQRTRALSDANAALRVEVLERTAAENALKKAQADLVQAGKLSALGQMSAGISHELNQPLMAIQQYADNGTAFLVRGKPDRAGSNLDRISEMATRMSRIIKNLRAFARNESEPVSDVDLLQVVEAALELSQARMRHEGVTIRWTPPDHPVTVVAGEVRLGQVLVNLISNASDAMTGQPNKEIEIRVTQDQRIVMLEVNDSGPGIEEPEKIFDPFYSTKEVGDEGMGLGLSISYGLVQSFGGEIRGRNRTQGGASFTITLQATQTGETK